MNSRWKPPAASLTTGCPALRESDQAGLSPGSSAPAKLLSTESVRRRTPKRAEVDLPHDSTAAWDLERSAEDGWDSPGDAKQRGAARFFPARRRRLHDAMELFRSEEMQLCQVGDWEHGDGRGSHANRPRGCPAAPVPTPALPAAPPTQSPLCCPALSCPAPCAAYDPGRGGARHSVCPG
jgi:hypothetical protein